MLRRRTARLDFERAASAMASQKGRLMAKKRDGKSRGDAGRNAASAAGRGLRRHLRRLEKMLAVAATKESRRVRKLEKAHIRRQRIEAELETARLAASLAPASSVKVPRAEPASSAAASTRKVTRPKAGKAGPAAKAAPTRTPAKTTPAKTVTRTPTRTAAKTTPAKTTPAKTTPATQPGSPTKS